MKIVRFFDFPVYQQAKLLHKEIVLITKRFPKEYYYLIDQQRRCSLSVVLNIAEGSAKRSDKDFNRYLENSLGSINEAVACLDVAVSLGLLEEVKLDSFLTQFESVKRQIGGFSRLLIQRKS